MSTPTNHWKLGLFVVVGFALLMCTLVFLGAQSLQKKVVNYRTYFDESVQGLEVGSAVRFRGVTIGTVSEIDIAADRRLVGVTSALALKDLTKLGLSEGKGRQVHIGVPTDLRAQLASQGITGVKFLQIDFFSVEDNPLPDLPFPEPANYIPAAVSTMKNLEDSVVRTVNRMPELADSILKITTQINHLLGEFKTAPASVATVLQHANGLLASMQGAVKDVDARQLSDKAQAALVALAGTLGHANAVIARLDGDKGLVTSAQRATGAVGDVALGARGVGRELEETLRDVQEMTASIQRVADALERDPDMLLKGRAKSK
ncbi:MAG: Paraquat-inducible protein [Myxococcales bacterium]|nr:Paraquat-inducible protein [Myxococcales bacterium]